MHFKKIVVACGDYVRKYGSKESNMLCDTFKVDYIGKKELDGKNTYLYEKDDRKLIHCRQFSNRGMSHDFIKELAIELKSNEHCVVLSV